MIFKRKIYDKNYPHKITAQQFSERLMRSFYFNVFQVEYLYVS